MKPFIGRYARFSFYIFVFLDLNIEAKIIFLNFSTFLIIRLKILQTPYL